MATSKPLLLLDIDGTLALLGESDERVIEMEVAGYPIKVSVHTPERIKRLSDAFVLVWASSWEHDALKLAEALQIGSEMPFLRFGQDLDRTVGNYKIPAIERFVRDRPMAWIDDDHASDVQQWARERSYPTLLVTCDPRTGLLEYHVEHLLDFAQTLEAGR